MKSINNYIKQNANNQSIIDRTEAAKLKGGKVKKKYIWNGCGGMIPQ